MMDEPPDDLTQRTRPQSLPDEPALARRPTSSSSEALPPSSRSNASPSRASVPPSEPRSGSRASFSHIELSADRPARLQMIVALLLALVLVAIPLYLWRRPRAESIAATGPAEPTAVPSPPPGATLDEGKVSIGEARNVSCHDPGTKKTAPEQCDHLVEIEKAFAKAIEDSASCVPRDGGGGTIQYVADVSFKRKSIGLTTPKDGRTMKHAKVVSACQTAVKAKLQLASLDAVPHAHARYKISMTASYPSAPR